MTESLSNVQRVCPDCVAARKDATQQNLIKRLKIAGQRNGPVYIKLPFEQDGRVEHMWVKANDISYESRKVKGILDNDPVLVTHVSCGDEIECDFEDIEEVL